MQGGEVLKDKVVTDIAEKHSKTPAQVILRWHLQYNNVVIPKSVTPSRIEENFNVFDFELSAQDLENIKGLDRNERKGAEPSEMNKR